MSSKKKEPQNQEEQACGCEECRDENKSCPEIDMNETQNAKPTELEETKSALLRTAAEFDNFKKRTAREKESLYAFAVAGVVSDVLPVFDSFERAVAAPCEDENYKKGCELIFSQLRDVLTKLGVTEMDAVGKPFDPELHNAVMQVSDDSAEEGTVVEVLQKGYLLGDRVVRHAMVKVAN